MNFKEIRDHYRDRLPKMMRKYDETGRMHFDPYLLDFFKWATPIEVYAWNAIRCYSVPMYPQIPALNYFLDFANPFKRFALECDGAQWHDKGKDARRDARLIDDGWTIYRITGSECNRIITEPWEHFAELRQSGETPDTDYQSEYWDKWCMSTVDGLVYALGARYIRGNLEYDDHVMDACRATLTKHLSNGVYVPPVKEHEPPRRSRGFE